MGWDAACQAEPRATRAFAKARHVEFGAQLQLYRGPTRGTAGAVPRRDCYLAATANVSFRVLPTPTLNAVVLPP